MTNKYFDGKVSFKECDNEFDKDLIATAKEAIEKYHSLMDIYRNADAVNAVMNLAKRCNKYIDETTPWALAKDEAQKDRLEAVLYNLLECIRLLSIMLTPVMPESCDSIKAQLNEANTDLQFGTVKEYSVGTATPLFARIDAEKVLAEIAAEQEAAKKAAEAAANVVTMAEIGIEDFAKVELKAAKIVNCEPVPKAKKLLKLTLNDGNRNRTVASGIAKFYKPEELIGKTVILVSNLKKATLCGIESEGMILAADCGEDEIKVIFLDDIPAGSKIR
jgi:methionyl-tRNA synthetase